MSSIINSSYSPWDKIIDWSRLDAVVASFNIDFNIGDYNELSLDLILLGAQVNNASLGSVIATFQNGASPISGKSQVLTQDGGSPSSLVSNSFFGASLGALSYRGSVEGDFYTCANILLKSGNPLTGTFAQYESYSVGFNTPNLFAIQYSGNTYTDNLILNLNRIVVAVGSSKTFAGQSSYRLLGRKI